MVVQLKVNLEEGWKSEENGRFGSSFVISFVDSKSSNVLFKWSPKLADREKVERAFSLLSKYDDVLKDIRAERDGSFDKDIPKK